MSEEVRPRVSREQKQEVETIHRIVRNEKPNSFTDALATTCSLAYNAIDAGEIENFHQQIIPPSWKSDRLTEAHIEIIDEELPDTWADSKLVAERVQAVVWHYLKTRLNEHGSIQLPDHRYVGDENSTQVVVKNAMWKTRLEENPDLSLSAIRSVCHQRLYGDIKNDYAGAFRDALENIEQKVQDQDLGVPTESE